MYVSNLPSKITGIQEVTLAVTATSTSVNIGQPFMVEQRGSGDAFMGTDATNCATGVRIKGGEKIGNFVSTTGVMFFRGAVGEKLYIYYFE